MKPKTKTQDFRRFWAMLKLMPGYSEDNREELKSGLVSQYTDGRTESLTVMYRRYPDRYIQMLHRMQAETGKSTVFTDSGAQWRRRVIAAVCTYLDERGYGYSPEDKVRAAKTTACRAAGVEPGNFNGIPVSRLREIYNAFVRQTKVLRNANEVAEMTGDIRVRIPVPGGALS